MLNFDIEQYFGALNSAIKSMHKETGRDYTLILIPESSGESIHACRNGEELPNTKRPEDIVAEAMFNKSQ